MWLFKKGLIVQHNKENPRNQQGKWLEGMKVKPTNYAHIKIIKCKIVVFYLKDIEHWDITPRPFYSMLLKAMRTCSLRRVLDSMPSTCTTHNT